MNATDFTGADLTSTATTFSVTGAGTLNVFVSETGLTAGNTGATFDSGLAQNVLSPGDTATLSTWLDLSDGLYALAIPLASQTFSANGTSTSSLTGLFSTSAYSLTQEYSITSSSGDLTSLSTISIVTTPGGGGGIPLPIPEISTWAMMGLGFATLALAGISARRRRDPRFAV